MNTRVGAAVSDMTGVAGLPRRNGELVFEAPWQGRAFGMALAVVEHLGVDWTEFQRRLIDAIGTHPEAPYYESWLAALEALVVDHGVTSAGELARACAVVRGPR